MKTFATLILFFALTACGYCASDDFFAFSGKSYIQRGVLKFDGAELPITVYVVCENGVSKMLLQHNAGRLAKFELTKDGALSSCEVGAFFSKSVAEKFALRDMRVALGFIENFSTDPIFIATENGKPKSIEIKNYKMEFLNYADIKGAKIPLLMKISDKNYSIELQFVSFIEKK